MTRTKSPLEDHKSPFIKQEDQRSPQQQGGRPMRRLLVIAGAMAVLMMMPPTTGWAEDAEFTPAQMKQIRKMFEEWYSQRQKMERKAPRAAAPTVASPQVAAPPPQAQGPSMPTMGDTTKQSVRYGTDFSGGSGLQGGRTIYARPFVKAPKTIIGGYIDFTISDCDGKPGAKHNSGGSRDCRNGIDFDQERFVPFFYSQVTDRLSVAAELEVEHGGPQGNQGDGDIKMEFATMDYRFNDAFNLRGGIILMPMGRFNLIHDSPLNDLPLRPMVSRLILPSTFAESGIGFFGTFYPTALSKIDYEFYLTNGFDGSDGQFSVEEGSGARSARGSFQKDNNRNKAIVSRVSFSPMLGIEVAGSIHHGQWNNEDDPEDHSLTLLAIDGNLQRGPFDIQGEAGWANAEGSGTYTRRAGTTFFTQDTTGATRRQHVAEGDESYVVPQNMFGYYVQLNYHFMPEAFTRALPSYFGQDSTFTGIIRWGQVDTNTDDDSNPNAIDRLTLGLNFRPIEDSVIKFAYTFNRHEKEGSATSGTDRNGFQINLSTYF